MSGSGKSIPTLTELFGEDPPKNWGRWGPEDEIGSLNYLDASQVLRGMREVQVGAVFTLQLHMGRKEAPGDPVWPGRATIERHNVRDAAVWAEGELEPYPGGLTDADDVATIALQGSTQYDALAHTWYDDQVWNGYDASTTTGGLSRASVLPIAEHGVVGRGVLIDMARFRGKKSLDKGETFTHKDIMAAAEEQGTKLHPRDILLIRTGWMELWYRSEREAFFQDFLEPGLTYSRELVQWFQDMEIPNLVTDTIANEVTYEPNTGVLLPLHAALMRNLGVLFTEMVWLKELAEACSNAGRWSFLYTAAPLKVVEGTGAPVNPIAIL